MLRVVEVRGGFVVEGAFPEEGVVSFIRERAGPLPLIIGDPPYGRVLDEDWDKVEQGDTYFCNWMLDWTKKCEELSLPGAALYVWGGIGEPGFRPFYRYLVEVERKTGYQLSSHITWSKKRAHGIQWGYLFTREEIAYLVLGDIRNPRLFNVPYLDKERGYEGYDPNYPAKSKFLRRTNVWGDITELFRGKVHKAQKPERLSEVMIETHTKEGEWVLDLFSGSGSTALAARKLGRRFISVEKDTGTVDLILKRLS